MFEHIELSCLWSIFAICILLATAAFAYDSNPNCAHGKVAIYARFSSDKQRDTSIDDQIRNVRIHLDKLGIPHEHAAVFFDKEISGEREDRDGYQKIRAMIRKGEISLVACDEIARFDRGSEMGVAVDEMELYGCRFVTADGHDSEHDPHGLMATIKGKMAGMANRELAHRVRRGIAGRALDEKGADGSHPYGYSTRYCDPAAAQNYCGIGPKPLKEVFINEAEAAIIREVFEMYANGMSQTGIARNLNERDIPLGPHSNRRSMDGDRYQNGWHKVRISKLLNQRKYVGIWCWGEYTHRKTRTGKRIVRPADPRDIIKSDRPGLAIVSLELWDKVQERLRKNREKFGFKDGQERRGRKSHYSEEYPSDLTGGLLFCGKCGSRLHFVPENNGQGPYFRCPIAVAHGKRHGITTCDQRGMVHRERAIKALTDYLKEYLLGCEGWLKDVYDHAISEAMRIKAAVPDKATALESRLKEIDSGIANITKALEIASSVSPEALVKRLAELESEKVVIERKYRQLESQSRKNFDLPSKEWIQNQLVDLAGTFMEDHLKAAKLFREFFGKVRVRIVVAPGKKRGHPVLEFQPNTGRLLLQIVDIPLTDKNNQNGHPQHAEEALVNIPLAGSDKLDKLMPTIDAMRNDGVEWREICAKLGIARSWTNLYYNRWKKLTQGAPSATDSSRTDAPVEDESRLRAI